MKTENRLRLMLICLFIVFAWYAVRRPTVKAEPPKQNEVVFGIEDMVKDLQRAVGAKPDGIVGYETMKKVNEAVKAERREDFNRMAAKSINTREMSFEEMQEKIDEPKNAIHKDTESP